MSRSRSFIFVINNHTFSDLKNIMELTFRYMCFGFEVGSAGTPHIQGYIYFYSAKTVKSVSKKIPRAHIEIANGNVAQNIDYASKDGDFYEFGNKPEQGRASWEKIEDVMKDPCSNPHLYQQYSKMYKQLVVNVKKDHKRRLFICDYDQRYNVAKEYDSVMIDGDSSVYDNERVCFFPAYTTNHVLDWINGYPQKITRGYELIYVDPEIIYLMYTNTAEYNYIIKKYSDYIEF